MLHQPHIALPFACDTLVNRVTRGGARGLSDYLFCLLATRGALDIMFSLV